MSKEKRKRIHRNVVLPQIIDEQAYTINASSSNAKKTIVFIENLNIEVWIDKHYQNRVYHGSDDGSVRDDIDYDNIEPLLIKSFKHLLYYSLKHKSFVFVNHPPKFVHNLRIVLKELINDDKFCNIVVEYHFINLNTIEVTLVTAFYGNDFKMSNGQYGIEFDGYYSKLIHFSNYKIIEIDNYEYVD